MPRRLLLFLTVVSSLVLALGAFCADDRQNWSGADDETPISQVQGKGHASPLADQQVIVRGVVTAVLDTNREHGFWITGLEDGDPATSDAVFISTGDVSPTVEPSNLVRVTGTVREIQQRADLTTTTIVDPEVETEGSERVPKPVHIGNGGRAIPTRSIDDDEMSSFEPSDDAIDFWESLEGMLVEVQNPVVVGPTSRFGDIVALADGGSGSSVRSIAGGVVVQDGDFNSERIHFSSVLNPGAPDVRVGDRFNGPVAGIVDYRFGNYRVLNNARLPEVVEGGTEPEQTDLVADESKLTIATYNVLNLTAQSSDERFGGVAITIVESLQSPDIIAVQEIQDDSGPEDDGVVSASETFARLIAAVVSAGGPRYSFTQIDPEDKADGGQPGGNIRVGYLYVSKRVHFVQRGESGPNDAVAAEGRGDDARLSMSPGRISPTDGCFAANEQDAEGVRKSLVAEFRFRGKTLFLINNHLSSKRGDEGLFGPNQPPTLWSERRRLCQAKLVGEFVDELTSLSPDAWIVVLGDMNEHEFREPMKNLAGRGLENLIERVPLAERYTYNYQGNSQILDNIFVSEAIVAKGNPEIDIVHCNIDLPVPEAASDHDPVVLRLSF